MGWEEVANAVVRRRVELGMRTREQLAAATGLSRKTLGEIERHERASYDPATIATVERALQWSYGTIERLVRGPTAPTPSVLFDDPDDLLPRGLPSIGELPTLSEFATVFADADGRLDPGTDVLTRMALLPIKQWVELHRHLHPLPPVEMPRQPADPPEREREPAGGWTRSDAPTSLHDGQVLADPDDYVEVLNQYPAELIAEKRRSGPSS